MTDDAPTAPADAVPLPTGGPSARLECWALFGIAIVFLVLQSPLLGIWEPWEADVAATVDALRGGDWFSVLQPDGEKTRAVAELPYGFWPAAALAGVLGTGELALRLPGLLLMLPVVMLAFTTTRRSHGRFAGWAAALGLLCLPLFIFHGRLAFGTAVGMNLSALSALAFLRLHGDAEAGAGWRWLAWIALAGAGLAAGVPATLGPLGVVLTLAVMSARDPSVERVPGVAAAGAILSTGFVIVLVAAVALIGLGQVRWGVRVALGGLLILGAVALAGSDAATLRKAGVARRLFPLPAVLFAVAAVAGGWWFAVHSAPEGVSVRGLLLWTDGLGAPAGAGSRPHFDLFVHQIGFGLFPLGALVPLAFADLLATPARDDEAPAARAVAPALTLWFALGFLAPALGAPISHAGFFLAAPAVAIAVGIWFARVLRSPPQPLLVVVAVVLLALLDSNLKHQTQSLADALVTGTVDAFPPKLPHWGLARLLNLGLLAVLLLYPGGLLRWLRPAVRAAFYPVRPVGHLHPGILFVGAGVAGIGLGLPGIDRLVAHAGWGRLVIGARWLILFAGFFLVASVLVRLAYNLRVRRLAGHREGGLLSAAGAVEALLRRPWARWIALAGVLFAWGGFLNLVVAKTLTTNFSQKDILDRYKELAQHEEPLFKYLVAERNSSFYADRLEALDTPAFRERAKDAARFFAIVPRKDLARINNEFRGMTGRTVPVLDERGYRFLLISNQLAEGEVDQNPITRALLTSLPEGVNPTSIVFDDQIELVGWQLDPATPHPGSELTFKLYWKAKKRIAGRWKVFVHLDAPGQRIHGDHDPVEGLFPTDNWKVGDLVQDEHRVVVKRTISSARFTLYVGLYRGDTRMPIVSGDKDNENRARVGTVNVR